MKIVASWGMRLLAVYLILIALIALIPPLNVIPGALVALLALVTGLLILSGR
jgi:hypothetical protein